MILRRQGLLLGICCQPAIQCTTATPSSFGHGDDLASFVSAPLIKPPIFEISHLEPETVTPGYWFLAPYEGLVQTPISSMEETCQIGPHIFDNYGNLVWSGACEFQNSNIHDFKTWDRNGSAQLSFILNERHRVTEPQKSNVGVGIGVIMQNDYTQQKIHTSDNVQFNGHEFKVLDDGRRGLMLTGASALIETPASMSAYAPEAIWAWDGTFREIDLPTGETIFEWRILDHISMSESTAIFPPNTSRRSAWDWFHPNSIDKDADGDYLLSSRFANCVYKVSGADGSIIWRLGGPNSSFVLDGFNFSRQHDARFQGKSGDKTLVSFLNNASDDHNSTSSVSAGYLVELDTSSTPMVAKLVKQWQRPDGRLSKLRGKLQLLENGHAFVSWSENGYITEFNAQGAIVLDAKFASHRFVTYRAHKANFTGYPTSPPALKAKCFGVSRKTATTAVYVSWNGATEVASWDFYGGNGSDTAGFALLGSSSKTSFETSFMWTGYAPSIFVEARAADGSSLGKSNVESTEIPSSWRPQGDCEGVQCPKTSPGKLSPSKLSTAVSLWLSDTSHAWDLRDHQLTHLYSLMGGLTLGVILSLAIGRLFSRFAGRGRELDGAEEFPYRPVKISSSTPSKV